MKRKTIKNILTVTAYLAVIIALLIILDNVTHKQNKTVETSYKTYTVQQGDNLTKIANRFYKDTYLPEAIFTIKQENNLKSSGLEVGQVLRLGVK